MKNDSPLIKQFIGICSFLVCRLGSMENSRQCLNDWFGGQDGIGKAYDFFVNKKGKWPWKPIIWKTCILPKHRFALWLLAHGKLLIKFVKAIFLINLVCFARMSMNLLHICSSNARFLAPFGERPESG